MGTNARSGFHSAAPARAPRSSAAQRVLLACAVTAWAAASWTAAPLSAGTNFWTSLGPNGGLATVVLPDPNDPRLVYAGTYDSGVFKSADAGATWQLASHGLTDLVIRSLAADPRHAGTVYAATFSTLYVSHDFAASWSAVPVPGGDSPASLAIDPRLPNTLYLVTSFDLMISHDGGEHWSANSILRRQSAYLVADPFRSSVFAVAFDGDRLMFLETTDGGATWVDRSASLPPRVAAVSLPLPELVVEPSRPGRLWIATAGGPGRHVFRSADGGATWEPRPGSSPLAVGTGGLVVAGTLRSLDGGDTWEPAGSFPDVPTSLAIGPDPSHVYAGARLVGMMVSGDGAQSWQVANRGLAATEVVAAAVDPHNPARLYTVVSSTGLWRSPNAGQRWRNLRPDFTSSRGETVLVLDPSAPSTLYFAGRATPLSRSTDAGTSWDVLAPADGCLGVQGLSVDPSSSSTLYAVGFFGGAGCSHPACTAVKSVDSGASWSCLALPNAQRIVVASSLPSTLYAVGSVGSAPSSLWTSADAGASWSAIGVDLPAGVKELAVDPSDEQRLFVSVSDGSVWRSRDGGLHWRESDRALPHSSIAPLLAIDPQNPQLLYAAQLDIGVYRSLNGGRSWQPILGGLPPLYDRHQVLAEQYTALIPDPRRSGTLYLATTGRGLLVYSAE